MTLMLDDDEQLVRAIDADIPDADLLESLDEEDALIDGRYVLERRIGTGTTSVVYLGYDLELQRDVVIKMIDDRYRSTLFEAASAARIAHTSVANIFEVSHEGGYIVMEVLSETVRDPSKPARESERRILASSAAEQPPASLVEALRWLANIARALSAAHIANIWHGDVKPHNVLVLPHSRSVKLIDFGMATSASCLRLAGTPEYIAPEVGALLMARRSESASPVVDIDRVAVDAYGLGCLAFEWITGRRPRPTAEVARSDGDEIAEGLLEFRRLERAMQVTPGFAPGMPTRWGPLPRRVYRILAATLDVSPGRRSTPDQLADAFDLYLAHRALLEERGNLALRSALWCRRYPSMAVAIAGCIAVAALGGAALTLDRERTHVLAELDVTNGEVAQARAKIEQIDQQFQTSKTRLISAIQLTIAARNRDAAASDTAYNDTLVSYSTAITELDQARSALRSRVATQAEKLATQDGRLKAVKDELDRERAQHQVDVNLKAAQLVAKDALLAAKTGELAALTTTYAQTVEKSERELRTKDDALALKDVAIRDLEQQMRAFVSGAGNASTAGAAGAAPAPAGNVTTAGAAGAAPVPGGNGSAANSAIAPVTTGTSGSASAGTPAGTPAAASPGNGLAPPSAGSGANPPPPPRPGG